MVAAVVAEVVDIEVADLGDAQAKGGGRGDDRTGGGVRAGTRLVDPGRVDRTGDALMMDGTLSVTDVARGWPMMRGSSRWVLSPVTAVLLGAALALVGNMATNVLQVSWRWWPALVWTGATLLVTACLWVEVARHRASGGSAPLSVTRVDKIDDPIRLGVHPSAAVVDAYGRTDRVPAFVERDRAADVRDALRAGGFVLLVGDSTAGKTRLAYEMMRACLPRHHCVQPAGPDALPAALAAARRHRPSVLWLDDLERYLGLGALTRADLEGLAGPRCLVLATMRAHERDDLSARHDPGRDSMDRQAARSGREVLAAVRREIRLDRKWSDGELGRARALAHDVRIARALTGTGGHGLAEVMAAGPQLLTEWRDAQSAASRVPRDGRTTGDPRGAALVAAAVDVRRAGYHRPVPISVLRELHTEYLRELGGAALRPHPWAEALAWATQPLHATSSLLQPAGSGCYLVFDYLVDAVASDGSAPPIPAVTWQALADFADPADLVEVIWQASGAGRVDDVPVAVRRALAGGQYLAAAEMAACLGEAGHEARAVALFEEIIERAGNSGTVPAADLFYLRQLMVWEIGEKIGGLGDPRRALRLIRELAADAEAALGADHRDTLAIKLNLARQLGASGEPGRALALSRAVVRQAIDHYGADDRLVRLARFEEAMWTREAEGAAAAIPLLRRLMAQAESADSGPSLALTCAWNLGDMLIETGAAGLAVPVLVKAVEGRTEAHGARHPRTLAARATYIRALHAAGRQEEAERDAAGLAGELRDVLGPDHPMTRSLIDSLPVRP